MAVGIELALMRHAQAAVPAGHAIGQWDRPLVAGADAAIERLLAGWTGDAPTLVVASDLERSRATATRIAAHFGTRLLVDPDWREVSLGDWEGRAWARIERDDGERLAAWYANWREVAPPGGEAWPDVIARVRRAATRVVAADGTRGRVLVVSHVGAIRAFLVGVAGQSEDAAFARSLPPLGMVTATLAVDPPGSRQWQVPG